MSDWPSPIPYPIVEQPLGTSCKLYAVTDDTLRQQLLHLGIDQGSRVERLTRGGGLQPLVLSFDGLALVFLPQAANLIWVQS